MTIVFVGGGNMASALIGGLLQQGFAAIDLAVADPDPQARTRVAAAFGVAATPAPDPAVLAVADVLMLAVKPQQMRAVAQSLAGTLREQLVVSIAAGIRTADLVRWLGGYPRVVRVMPNTPALIRKGVSGLWAPPEVGPGQRAQAQRILAAVGETLWCDRESQLDCITAVSGSGPAYVLYFLEALERAAAGFGFDAAAARKLAYGTFAGAVALAEASPEPAAVLRERVTSKGGTTEAALGALNAADVAGSIVTAVRAADARARQLGELFGRDG